MAHIADGQKGVCRREAGEPLPPPPKTAIAGPEYFGLTHPDVILQIESLDPEHLCSKYWNGKQVSFLSKIDWLGIVLVDIKAGTIEPMTSSCPDTSSSPVLDMDSFEEFWVCGTGPPGVWAGVWHISRAEGPWGCPAAEGVPCANRWRCAPPARAHQRGGAGGAQWGGA